MCIEQIIPFITLFVSLLSVIFFVILIIHQNKIINRQARIHDEQFLWNRILWLNGEYQKYEKLLRDTRLRIENERENFYMSQHTKDEVENFEHDMHDEELTLAFYEISLIGLRAYIQSTAKPWVEEILRETNKDEVFKIIGEKYPREMLEDVWEKFKRGEIPFV